MRIVLYSAIDYEPITILDIEPWMFDFCKKHPSVRVAVRYPISLAPMAGTPVYDECKYVDIWMESVIRRGRDIQYLFYTNHEEAAMMLKSEFLPGQRKAVNDAYQVAFMHGLVSALRMQRD